MQTIQLEDITLFQKNSFRQNISTGLLLDVIGIINEVPFDKPIEINLSVKPTNVVIPVDGSPVYVYVTSSTNWFVE